MPLDGVIRLEDLLRSPALQLRLIAGESGTSRRVAWAHVSELEDPTPVAGLGEPEHPGDFRPRASLRVAQA
jgi:hypothetical protein